MQTLTLKQKAVVMILRESKLEVSYTKLDIELAKRAYTELHLEDFMDILAYAC